MRLVILGPPGGGKGTQSRTLAAELGVPHIATGDLFRAEIAAESELGKLADSYISHGNLVPDEVVNSIVRERLAQPDGSGFVLDGYPRTEPQCGRRNRRANVRPDIFKQVLHSVPVGEDVCRPEKNDAPRHRGARRIGDEERRVNTIRHHDRPRLRRQPAQPLGVQLRHHDVQPEPRSRLPLDLSSRPRTR